MAAGSVTLRFEHQELRAPVPPDSSVRLVRLAPGGRRLAFVRDDGVETGLWTGGIWDPTGTRRIVAMSPDRIEDIAFSPDGEYIAYRVAALLGARSTVGWARVNEPGEVRRVYGTGFAWTPGGKALLVADPGRKALMRYGLDDADGRKLSELDDDMDPAFPSHISTSPDGAHIVYTTGREGEDISEVWVVTRDDNNTLVTRLLTELPGASAHLLPFWSPKGVTLGLFCVHEPQDKSALIVVPKLEGEGEILYESSHLDPARTPAWAPSGKHIVFFQADVQGDDEQRGPASLVALDVRRETLTALCAPGELTGSPSFHDERTLVVDGERVAHILTFTDPL
jgi:Tol biopolymer transport system component